MLYGCFLTLLILKWEIPADPHFLLSIRFTISVRSTTSLLLSVITIAIRSGDDKNITNILLVIQITAIAVISA